VVAAHAGDHAAAAAALGAAQELMPTAGAGALQQAELMLRCAQAAHGIGDEARARSLARDAELVCRRVVDPGSIQARVSTFRDRMAGVDPLIASLSPAETRVLRQLATHRTLQEIAERLFVSRPTVKTHVAAIYSKLGVATRTEAVALLGPQPDEGVILDDPDVAVTTPGLTR
jgi:LuxR family transcriptional regulator, maltose regulon positive regulatory protein